MLDNTKKCETKILANEIICINELFCRTKDDPISVLSTITYFSLILYEMTLYIDNNSNKNRNLKGEMKLKNQLESIRGRIKPQKLTYVEKIEKIKKHNEDSYVYFKNSKTSTFNCFIKNGGIFRVNNKIIGTTFYFDKAYNKVLKKADIRKFCIELGTEISSMLIRINDVVDLNVSCTDIKNKANYNYKDYDFYTKKLPFINVDISNEETILILNVLSKINFYFEIISSRLKKDSKLKNRICYILYDSIFSDFNEFYRENFNKDEYPEIEQVLEGNSLFSNRNIRNCMYHYEIRCSDSNFVPKSELFMCGIIEFITHVSSDKFFNMIENQLSEIKVFIENIIIKG